MKRGLFILLAFFYFSNISYSQVDESSNKVNKQAVLIFKSTVFDYGVMNEGDEGIATFEFKNISKADVIITNVKTSCGCTDAEWPEGVIKKNKKGTIKIKYDTTEIGKFHNSVFVHIDKLENPIKLEVKGEVLPVK